VSVLLLRTPRRQPTRPMPSNISAVFVKSLSTTCGKFYSTRHPKICAAGPLPTSVLREVVDTLLPFIWVMCNASLREGHLPESQKAAVITPVLKKTNADSDELKNYRPISNLTFISKVIERLVVEQITRHL